jgi:CDGSH-type Zn-finger protein
MEKEETPQLDHAIVTIRPKGPVVISGNFITIDEDGNEIERRERLSICRCGLSQKLPYCDGAHKAVMNR